MKKLLSLMLAAILAISCLPVAIAAPTAERAVTLGWDISDFNAVDNYGNPISGDIFADTPVTLLNYWATWCGPCVSEMPHLQRLHEELEASSDPIGQILGIISEGGGCTIESATAFLESNGYTYTNIDPDAVLSNVTNQSGYIPQQIFVDSNGIVLEHMSGGLDYQSFKNKFVFWNEVAQNAGTECTATFVSGVDGSVIGTQTVPCGGTITFPDPGMESPYNFNGWEAEGDGGMNYMCSHPEGNYDTIAISRDVTIVATYTLDNHIVKFYDGVTGERLSLQTVEHGSAAVPPEHPEHEGYEFQGWDKDYTNITENVSIYGICVPVGSPEYSAGDVNEDGVVDQSDALLILRYALGVIDDTTLNTQLADYNGDGAVNQSDALLVLRVALNIE